MDWLTSAIIVDGKRIPTHVKAKYMSCLDAPQLHRFFQYQLGGAMERRSGPGLDPIFFFHHCFVDQVFWLWQTRHGFTDHL